MFRIFIIICIVLGAVKSFGQENSTSETTYYLIRHAEKDRSNATEKDAHLTEKGLQRAQDWNDILQNIHFDAVYATDYKRTKETVQPTASRNELKIIIYNADSYFDEAFKKATKGKTVLVVGHSNTIPDFVNAVIGKKKYYAIDDDNNGNLYIVTLIEGNAIDTVLTIN